MFVQNVIMYVAIVVFYSAEFKFTYVITWNIIVHLFWNGDSVPYGLKNALKSPELTKIPLSPYNFSSIHQIFMKFCQNVETIVMNIKVLLLNPEKLWFVSLGDF